jgi:SPP1 gp7 family putative phage head morphogenesis protein
MAFGLTSPEHIQQVQLGNLLAAHLAAADLLGRLHVAQVGLRKIRRPVQLARGMSQIHAFAEDDQQQSSDGTLGVNFSFDLPPTGAVDFLRNLTPVTRDVFDGLTQQYRNDAFTVAGVSDQKLLGKIRDALSETLAKGGTREDFHQAVDRMTTEAGIEKISAFELDTIFSTNVGRAYSAGRLIQMREPHMMDALPYWQYWTAGDLRVRPEHAVLDGFLARAIDPVWAKIYPPSGFNCRCSVVPIPADEALKIDPDAEHGGFERLPMLARVLVPQRGFHTLIHA